MPADLNGNAYMCGPWRYCTRTRRVSSGTATRTRKSTVSASGENSRRGSRAEEGRCRRGRRARGVGRLPGGREGLGALRPYGLRGAPSWCSEGFALYSCDPFRRRVPWAARSNLKPEFLLLKQFIDFAVEPVRSRFSEVGPGSLVTWRSQALAAGAKSAV
eukprot:COSAG04_NODE_1642_length_6070_cov_9.329928_7_plen_160_part_00